MKVLIAEMIQEVSTFNPAVCDTSAFDFHEGQDVLDYYRHRPLEVGGALSVFEAEGFEVVGAFAARAKTSNGLLTAEAWNEVSSRFLNAIRNAPPVDGVYFAMHGAMGAENELDPEGYLLQEARKILGDDMPITLSLDLHGIVTDRMLQAVNAVTMYQTYPHCDMYETGARGAKLLVGLLKEGTKPVIAMVRIPALVRGDEMITETGLIGHRIRESQAFEETEGGLAAGMFWGNPFTDVPDLCSNSVVVTDGDPERAADLAVDLALKFWEDRATMQVPLVSLDDAVAIAKANEEGTVVMVDAADATSSGASGDSNAILRALVEGGYEGSGLFPVVDAPAAHAAAEAGIGATIEVTVGGTLDPARFTPLPVTARVKMLSDGAFINESWGTIWEGGLSAVLEVGKHVVIVTSQPVHLFDRSLFLAHGQDPQRFDVVVQKSPHCQPQFFRDWAAKLVDVDAPGSTSANLPYLGHTICRRPMFPMERDTQFEPEVLIFQRG
ncbi:MAG: M81 family metallopeptidase [Thermomicrobiales bacterium]|nr:M81 family metallopeptidase [Thermomicrobiales bacterium]